MQPKIIVSSLDAERLEILLDALPPAEAARAAAARASATGDLQPLATQDATQEEVRVG